MRIAFDYQVFGLQRHGGISRYFFEVARQLAREPDVQASVLAPLYINAYLGAAQTPLRVVGRQAPSWPRTGRLAGYANRLLFPPLVRRSKPDIVHETYYSRRRTSPSGPKVVLTVLDMIHERFPESFSRRDITFGAKAPAVARADHVICISHHTRKDLIELFGTDPAKISVVHLGFSLTCDAPVGLAPRPRPYLLYVGARGGYKNFSGLLAAYAGSAELRREFDLVAFGGSPFTADESAEISRLGLADGKVVQVGGDDTLLAAFYRHASLFVYPSLYEGFGIPPLEAMSFDCPVVSHHASSIPEVVGDAAVLTDCGDQEALREAMEQVLNDTGRRAELVARGRQRLTHFSWERCAAETLAVYRGLVR